MFKKKPKNWAIEILRKINSSNKDINIVLSDMGLSMHEIYKHLNDLYKDGYIRDDKIHSGNHIGCNNFTKFMKGTIPSVLTKQIHDSKGLTERERILKLNMKIAITPNGTKFLEELDKTKMEIRSLKTKQLWNVFWFIIGILIPYIIGNLKLS